MIAITLEWWQWVLPAIVAAVVAGLYNGWRIMGLWTVGVFFSGLVAARMGPKLELFINKMLNVMGQMFAIASDRPEDTVPTPTVTIASPWEPVATAGLRASRTRTTPGGAVPPTGTTMPLYGRPLVRDGYMRSSGIEQSSHAE